MKNGGRAPRGRAENKASGLENDRRWQIENVSANGGKNLRGIRPPDGREDVPLDAL
jgi:hypothetical protein